MTDKADERRVVTELQELYWRQPMQARLVRVKHDIALVAGLARAMADILEHTTGGMEMEQCHRELLAAMRSARQAVVEINAAAQKEADR